MLPKSFQAPFKKHTDQGNVCKIIIIKCRIFLISGRQQLKNDLVCRFYSVKASYHFIKNLGASGVERDIRYNDLQKQRGYTGFKEFKVSDKNLRSNMLDILLYLQAMSDKLQESEFTETSCSCEVNTEESRFVFILCYVICFGMNKD